MSAAVLHLCIEEEELVITVTLRLAHIREVFAVELQDRICAGLQCWRRRCGDGYNSSKTKDGVLHCDENLEYGKMVWEGRKA